MKITIGKNYNFCGDNLEWLNDVPDSSVDLCYIDPPFFSNRNYEVIWGNGYELRSFGDRFSGGISHYIEWMRPRVELISKKLKASGCIVLHCDWHASHRLRVMLDEIFGEENFRNEIIWQRTPFSGSSKSRAKKLPAIHDSLLYYAKSKEHDVKFSCPSVSYSEKYLKRFKHKDARGYYRKTLLKTFSKETFDRLKREDRLIHPVKKGANYSYKQYLDESKGKTQIGDIWTDINMLNPVSSERLGYPTQKPEALIRRVIEMTSHKGDVVLDCFVGGGTTAKVAFDLERTFVVGDVSPVAARITAERLTFDCPNCKFETKNLPRTTEGFKKVGGHKFAEMVCDLMGWELNPKKSNDKGIDGWDGNGDPIQVKNHEKPASRDDVQKFVGALASAKKKRGVFVAWDFSRPAVEYIAEVRQAQKIEIVTKKCHEIFNGLLIDTEKQREIESLYNEKRPKTWKATSRMIDEVLDEAIEAKGRPRKGRRKEARG